MFFSFCCMNAFAYPEVAFSNQKVANYTVLKNLIFMPATAPYTHIYIDY
jgi:hypothetical protein